MKSYYFRCQQFGHEIEIERNFHFGPEYLVFYVANFGIKRVLFVLETVCLTPMEMFSHHNFDRNLEQIVKLAIQCYIFWRTVIWVGANNKENKLFFYLQRCAVFSCHFKSSGLHFAPGKYFPIWITDHYSVAVLELDCILRLEDLDWTLISCL